MIGINSSGIFGTKQKPNNVELKQSSNEIDILKKTVSEMKEFIQNQENSANVHRKELVDLISSITKSCESAVSSTIEQALAKRVESVPSVTPEQTVVKIKESIPKQKNKKKKFAPVCDSIYSDLLTSRPDISCVDRSTLYVGEDNNIYHKSGIKYNLVDALYLCRLAGKNK